MREAAKRLCVALCAGLTPATILADQGPDALDRVAEAVAVRVEGVEALGGHVLVLFDVACDGEELSEYVVVPVAPTRLERSVGEEEDAAGCSRQRMYALPRARFVVQDGKIAALDARAPAQRRELLAPADVLEADLGIPFYWVNTLNVLSGITAEYRVALTAERELELTLLRVEFLYQGGQKIFEDPPEEPAETGPGRGFADIDEADASDESDDEYEDVPYAPFHPDLIPGMVPAAEPPTPPPAEPALVPAEPAGPDASVAPAGPAGPDVSVAPQRAAPPPAATAFRWTELALGGGCLVIAIVGGLRLRRKR